MISWVRAPSVSRVTYAPKSRVKLDKINTNMEAAKAIRYGDAEALRYNEHQILYEIENRLIDCCIDHEHYMTFWIACYQNREVATDMFEVFMNTCSTAFRLDKYEEIMELYSVPTMFGAIANENLDILDYIVGYLSKRDIYDELYAQHGDQEDWPVSLLKWYDENFS